MSRSASAGGLISTNRLLGQALGATVIAALLSIGHGADGVPALVQIVFWYDALAEITHNAINLSPLAAGIIALGMNVGGLPGTVSNPPALPKSCTAHGDHGDDDDDD